MNETSPGVIDAETPVNPYSLLEAVNRSSDSANAAWLIYIALMSYLLITVAGISHKDLLLNSDITLPVTLYSRSSVRAKRTCRRTPTSASVAPPPR